MFKLFVFVLKAGPMILWNYFSWILPYSRHPEKYPLEVRYNRVRKLVLKLLKRLNVVIHAENEYLINDPIYSIFIVNAVSTVGSFLISFFEKKYNTKENNTIDDDIPF